MNTRISAQTYEMLFSTTLRDTTVKYLTGLLGEAYMKHFDVKISGTGKSTKVTVVTKDQAGSFLYHGTKPHTEIAGNGTAIPFYGMFAHSVQHPGMASKKTEIDNVVAEAVQDTKAIMREFGRG